jgi:hypothetical protein
MSPKSKQHIESHQTTPPDPWDVAAAARVGMRMISVRTGGFGDAALTGRGPTAIIDSPAELIGALWRRRCTATADGGLAVTLDRTDGRASEPACQAVGGVLEQPPARHAPALQRVVTLVHQAQVA